MAEVVEVERLVRLPHSPPRVLGLCALRREVIPVIGLNDPGPDPSAPQPRAGLLVMIFRTGRGIWAVRINPEGTIVAEEALDDPAPAAVALGPVFLGTIRRGETCYAVIDPEGTWQNVRQSVEDWYCDRMGRDTEEAALPAPEPGRTTDRPSRPGRGLTVEREGPTLNLTLRHRILTIGAATGTAGAAFTLTLSAWLGINLGASLGIALAAAFGAAGTLTTLAVLERLVREHLAAVESTGWGLPGQAPDPIGDGTLNDTIDLVRQALRRARQVEDENEDIGRMTRAFWTAVHGKGNASAPAPDARTCVASFFEMFRETADTLVRYSSSLEEANERMASGAVDQSDTVTRTTSTVEALSDKIDRISQNAENATEACERTRQEARRGLEQVKHVIEGMDRLRAQIEINGRKVRRLGDRSVEIGTIVELIRGISSRTDMLALNATIESVRAGEHGRGFAVVAEEIRKLAERTAGATRDIGTLVEAIQADTHESIRALGEEQSEMEQEAQRVREAGAALERISQVAEHSAQLVDGISRSTNDQVLAAQELVRAMQRISDVSHLTLERTTQSRESIRGLVNWCDRLTPLSAPPSGCRRTSRRPRRSTWAGRASHRVAGRRAALRHTRRPSAADRPPPDRLADRLAGPPRSRPRPKTSAAPSAPTPSAGSA